MCSSSPWGHVALAHEGLEVRAELHRVGRIHVDGLHLAAEALVSGEGVHHHQGIAQDQPVHPPVAVLVCLEQPIAEGEVALPEEIEHVHLAVAGMPLQGFEDRGGGQPLVHEQGQGRHVEGEPLGLPGPVEGRGEGGVVTPGGRRLLLAELRLRADLGPEQGARLGVGVAPGAPFLAGPARALLRRRLPAGHLDSLPRRGACCLAKAARHVPGIRGRRSRAMAGLDPPIDEGQLFGAQIHPAVCHQAQDEILERVGQPGLGQRLVVAEVTTRGPEAVQDPSDVFARYRIAERAEAVPYRLFDGYELIPVPPDHFADDVEQFRVHGASQQRHAAHRLDPFHQTMEPRILHLVDQVRRGREVEELRVFVHHEFQAQDREDGCSGKI